MRTWLTAPLSHDVSGALERLRRAPDVQQLAIMPDVHLSADVCIGVAVATTHLLYPQAVGGDIGCGMFAVALDIEASALASPGIAGKVLAEIGRAVPARRRNRRLVIEQPEAAVGGTLSHPSLESLRRNEGALEFATLGGGNHFLEIQADEESRLWLMVHSGSRALGQAIRDHHLSRGEPVDHRLRVLDANSTAGAEYLHDASCARRYADASRKAIAEEAGRVLGNTLGAKVCWETAITTDHNHVTREEFGGRDLWIHRKGAMPAHQGESGVLPGSMGSPSFHVAGRGHEPALCSSAHGAGRAMSRTEARSRISERTLRREMQGVWYDTRLAGQLRDEAPSAYKDVGTVLRAQRELVKVIRTLRPILNYKGV
ncbi:RtcB family protein [Paludibaculum fermentans]|uniref:3'-phosphate/5'-hydroxy nucleic acid ligase n=1 Tax=Paludibaculum fermentans TaxID=1473598 RepID=A0A7S7SNV1_PALFE|nr:RtcB family protein [Paludibaculum fermentans]QOY90921.1 RtcB family protein [Paludibaculum fermentans]